MADNYEIPMNTKEVMVAKKCKCGGDMVYQVTFETHDNIVHLHECNVCHAVAEEQLIYPFKTTIFDALKQ